MAQTCLDIVTTALRLGRIIPVGRDPKAAEMQLGLDCLQSLYDQWVAGGMFGRLTDVYLTADATAQEGKRYYVPAGVTLTDATSDYVPKDCGPFDYGFISCADGTTRQPRDLAIYEKLTSTGTRTVKLYDRTAWVNLLDLALSDLAPLSSRGKIGLSSALATSGAFLAAFGAQPIPEVRATAGQFMASLSYKMGSTQDRAPTEYF